MSKLDDLKRLGEQKRAAAVEKAEQAERAERKKGRPRLDEKRDKPWEALGMSERTYYRRLKEKNGKETK